jgi:hypothetical protein
MVSLMPQFETCREQNVTDVNKIRSNLSEYIQTWDQPDAWQYKFTFLYLEKEIYSPVKQEQLKEQKKKEKGKKKGCLDFRISVTQLPDCLWYARCSMK